jgi:hypothetical protein
MGSPAAYAVLSCSDVPDVVVELPTLAGYDELFEVIL